MAFATGDRVHIPRLGTGIVRDVRNGGRYLVEIKGRTMIVGEAQMERAEGSGGGGAPRGAPYKGARKDGAPKGAAYKDAPYNASLDLHGKTVDEAVAALDEFLNAALLASAADVRVIHGKSGTRIRDAVHRRLRELPPVRSFRVDPRNPGVTIVKL